MLSYASQETNKRIERRDAMNIYVFRVGRQKWMILLNGLENVQVNFMKIGIMIQNNGTKMWRMLTILQHFKIRMVKSEAVVAAAYRLFLLFFYLFRLHLSKTFSLFQINERDLFLVNNKICAIACV